MELPAKEDVHSVRVYPKKLRNGQFTLYQQICLKEFVPMFGGRAVRKSITRVWPVIKQTNGLGLRFAGSAEARRYVGDWERATGKQACRQFA